MNSLLQIINEEILNELIDPNTGNLYQPPGLDPTHVKLFEDIIGHATGNSNKPITLYKNPKSIDRFEKWVKGILDDEGNLYIEDVKGDWLHTDMAIRLKQLSAIHFHGNFFNNKDNFLSIYRIDNTNNFGLSNSNKKNRKSTEIIEKANQRNPHFRFFAKYYDDVLDIIKQ